MILRLLSPFATTYSKLSLQNKWWHRLSIVGLVFCVVAAFALTLALTLGPDIQSHKAAAPAKGEHGPWEQYAQIDRDEITQIEEYAISIQADARFKTDKRAKVLNGLSQLSCDGQPAAGKCPKAYALTVIGTVSTSPRADTAFDMSS